MTHPDDEISICAWIRDLVRQGNRVYLSWTHSNPVREAEARAAAALLGVPNDHLYFFGATDGSVCDEIPDLIPRFRTMMDAVRPDRVACGAFEQGHIDHDSTNYLVNQTFQGTVIEVPFYHTYDRRIQKLNRFSSPHGEEVRMLTGEDRQFKKMIAKQYPSQNIWRILFWYEVCSTAAFMPAKLPYSERMRIQTHRNWLQPNHPAHIASRVQHCPTWKRWLAAVQRAEERVGGK